jgi:hypothetical protein
MIEWIRGRTPGALAYGITPPKLELGSTRLLEVAERQRIRISELPVDALVVYDIQDESLRTDATRPFPYSPCVPSVDYALSNLSGLEIPKIVYQCVGALGEHQLASNLRRLALGPHLAVLVGAASQRQVQSFSLRDGYALRRQVAPTLPLGGVLIAERHQKTRSEHQRVLSKAQAGVEFFVTQAVYSALESKNVLSDLAIHCEDSGTPAPYVMVTLSPCGSTRTLEFLQWLGVSIPRYLENDLRRAKDILGTSLDICSEILADLVEFSKGHRIALGCNVESVSLSKVEIEASVELVHRARRILGRPSP